MAAHGPIFALQDLKKSIVKHDKHTFSPVESSDGKAKSQKMPKDAKSLKSQILFSSHLNLAEAIDRGWHDFVHCDEATLRNSGFVDKDDTVCFRRLASRPIADSRKSAIRYRL